MLGEMKGLKNNLEDWIAGQVFSGLNSIEKYDKLGVYLTFPKLMDPH